MLKIAFILLSLFIRIGLIAQADSNELITVTGKLMSTKDSSAVTASILYEKLPYYDDMGIISSKADGRYSIPMVPGNSYLFSITKEGFRKLSTEVKIQDSGEGAIQRKDFYLEVDEVALIKLENLIFARSSPTIAQSSYAELNELAKWMNDNPSVVLQLEGHTDFRGNATANMELSQARVDAVKDFLVNQRVKKNRILTKAFGGTQPLSREDTEEAKALNRRVEVRVIRR